MINLIPNQEKKKKIRYFYYRLLVLFLVMIGFSFFVASLALLPAYFLSSSKNNIIAEKLNAQKNQTVPLLDEGIEIVVKDINAKLSLLESAEKNKFLVSEKVFNAVFAKKTSDIKITQISYENNQTKDKKIIIRGTAPSRESLLSFRRALEESKSFKTVDLPISNFIKGSDIQFYLSLIPS